MKLDPISVIEACYAPVADDRSWAVGVLERLTPIARGDGLFAAELDASRSGRGALRLLGGWEGPDRSPLRAGGALDDAATADLFHLVHRSPPVTLLSERLKGAPQSTRARIGDLLLRARIRDCIGLVSEDAERVTLVIGAPARQAPRLSPRLRHQLARIAAHVVSARRLRRLTRESDEGWATADAVLDPTGKVLDADGEASEHDARGALTEAVRRMERARARSRHVDADEALELWRGLVDGRWSLVDRCDEDGKRLILARRNEPHLRDPKALAPRERHVAAYAAMGHSNKFIAYLLGLSSSTVATRLRSAKAKLGVRTRRELIALLRRIEPSP